MDDSVSLPKKDKDSSAGDGSSDPGATVVGQENVHLSLLQKLLEEKIISPAQGQVLLSDQQATGMDLDEVILARGWITAEKLDEIAPGRAKKAQDKLISVAAGSKNYQENLKQYRRLMEKILGISWD